MEGEMNFQRCCHTNPEPMNMSQQWRQERLRQRLFDCHILLTPVFLGSSWIALKRKSMQIPEMSTV